MLALIAAIVLGKRLARPIKAIAAQAHLVADLDLDDVEPLPRSRVLEFDDQASAFNAMLTGLRAFSAYVPRSLVARLVRTGDADATRPREAIVTVMFTDIAGFTSISEQLPATAGAAILNHHFSLLCDAIGAEGGTVDKFLGDGAMAFFGAPDRLKGHGAAAVRAAIAIREALKADNRTAVENGRPPLSVRIGIHTGPVIVGNIGAADRVNYTIVGDTVNVSQRLQELGKLLSPDAETAIVISGETAARLDEQHSAGIVGAAPAARARRADRRVPRRGIRRRRHCRPAGGAKNRPGYVAPFRRRPLVVASDRPSRAETAFTPKVDPWCRCAPNGPKVTRGVSGRQVRAEFVSPA